MNINFIFLHQEGNTINVGFYNISFPLDHLREYSLLVQGYQFHVP